MSKERPQMLSSDQGVLDLRAFVGIGFFVGLLLPYISGYLGLVLINVPWSLLYGSVPFVLYDVVGGLIGIQHHWLKVLIVIISPLATTYLLILLASSSAVDGYRKALIWLAATSVLINLPISFVTGNLNLPFYHKYVAF